MKRLLEYLMVFLIVFIASCGTMVMVYKANASSADTGLFAGQDTSMDETSDPILDGMIASVLATQNVKIDLDIKAKYKENEVAILGTCFVGVKPNLAIDLEAQIMYNKQDYAVYVHYENDVVYVSAFGQTVQFSLSQMTQGIQPLLEVIKPFLSKIDLSFLKDFGIDMGDMENFDISSLTSLLNYLKTKENELGYEVNFDIPEKLFATLLLDQSYNITEIILPKTTIAGVTVEADIKTTFNNQDFSLPSVKEGTYLDITHLVDLVQMVLGVSHQKTFSFDIKASIFGYAVEGQAQVDFSNDLRAQFVGSIEGINVEILYVDGQIYITILGLKLQATLEELKGILAGLVPQIDFDKLDFAQLSIQSLIANITKEDEDIVIAFNKYGLLTLGGDVEGRLSKVQYTFDQCDVQVDILTGEANTWLAPQGEYTTLGIVQSYADNVLAILNQKKISGDISLNLGGKRINGQVVVDFNNELQVQLTVFLLGKQIDIYYDGCFAYLCLDDVRIKATIAEIVDWIKSQFDWDISNSLNIDWIDFSTIDIINMLKKVSFDTWNSQQLSLSYDMLHLAINRKENELHSLEANYNNQVNIALDFKDYEINHIDIATYSSFSSVTALIDYVMQVVENKSLATNLSLIMGETTITAYIEVSFKEQIALKIQTVLLDQEVEIVFQNDVLTIIVGQNVLQVEPKDVKELLTILQSQFDIDMTQIMTVLDKIFPNGQLTLPTMDIDINQIIEIMKTSDIHLGLVETSGQYTFTLCFGEHEVAIDYTLEQLKNARYTSGTIALDAEIDCDANIAIQSKEPTVVMADLMPLVYKIGNIWQQKKASGVLSVVYKEWNVRANYLLDFSQMTSLKDIYHLQAQLSTNLYGQEIVVTMLEEKIYFKISEFGIYIPLNELPQLFNWIQSTFGVDMSLDSVEIPAIDLSTLLVSSSENLLTVKIAQLLTCTIAFKEQLNMNLSYQDVVAEISIDATSQDIILEGSYQHYALLTNLVDSVYGYMQSKQVALSAKATIYEQEEVKWNITCALQADFAKSVSFYAFVGLEGVQDMEFSLAYEESMLYVNYDKLKVKLSKDAIFELIDILGKGLGGDKSFLSNSKDSIVQEKLDIKSLQKLLPSLDFGNPLRLLECINSIKYEDESILVSINCTKLLGKNTNDITVQILLDDYNLKGISIKDCYTGETNTERFDLEMELIPFEGVTKLTDKEVYMDLSSATGLVQALVNTSSLQVFHITATLDIKMQLLSLKDAITMKLPIDIAIDLSSGQVEVMATIGPIPVIAPIDNDVPYVLGDTVSGANAGKNRMLKVYYSKGYVYFYRSEQVPRFAQKDRTYEKMLKITLEEFLADPMTILSYGCGFKDIVMNEINKAVDKAVHRETPLDFSNLLLDYERNVDTYSIVLNLAELANNTDLDTLTLSLSTSQVEGKEYITKGSLYVHMPIASSFVLDIESTDLKLEDIGQTLDFSKLKDFVSNYPYKVDEKWEASNNEWTLASATVYEVQFDSLGGEQVPSVKGAIDTEYTLPILPDKIVEGEDAKIIYSFGGWYSSSTFEGTAYTHNIITKGDLILYAKWVEIEKYCTVYYVLDDAIIDTYYALSKSPIKDLDLGERVVIKGNTKEIQVFDCWIDENGDKITLVPDCSTKLYARFITIKASTKYQVIYHTNISEVLSPDCYYDEDRIDLPQWDKVVENKNGTTTTYQFEGWYEEDNFTTKFNGIMPNRELHLYAKWEIISVRKEQKVTILDNDQIIYEKLHEVGQKLSLPTTIRVDTYTEWYEDSSYLVQTTLPSIMPDKEVVLHIRNRYQLTYTYYTVQHNEQVEIVEEKWLYQGEILNLPEQKSYALDYEQFGQLSHRMIYMFIEYQYSDLDVEDCMPNKHLTVKSIYQSERKAWCVVTFDVSWVKPSSWIDKNSAFQGKITCISKPQSIPSILVLEGDRLQLSDYFAYCTYSYQCMWVTDTYNMKVVTWNTSSIKNVVVSKIQNGSYDKLDSLIITDNTTLYATWGIDK